MPAPVVAPFEPVVFSPGREEWIEFGPPRGRRRVAFHDYAAIYAVPGLYETVFQDTLGMRSHIEVVRMFGEALAQLGRDPSGEHVFDLGAGSGAGGEQLRALGVGAVVGLDLEPTAQVAAARDRPGVYDDFLVGDLGAFSEAEFGALRALGFTAMLALAAIGVGHIPPPVLDRALGLLGPGGLFGFAVTPALLPGSEDPAGVKTGFPAYFDELFSGRAQELARHGFVHRRQTDGTPHDAVALIGRLR